MAAATLQKEKDATEKDELKAVIEKDNLNAATGTPKDIDKQTRKDAPETVLPHESLTGPLLALLGGLLGFL